jgi:thiol peroxidase
VIWVNVILGGAVGLAVGAVAGYIGKCRSGTCPLTGNPYSGAIVGTILGVLIALALGRGASAPPAAAGAIGEVTSDEEFTAKVLQAPRPVVVDFYADWCGFCKQLEPTLAALADQFRDRADFVKVNVDKHPDLAQRYNVRGIPLVLLVRDGAEAHRWEGAQPADEFRKVLDTIKPAARKESPMTQPTTSVTMKGKPVALVGRQVAVGDAAPDFVAVDTDLKPVKLSDYRGKVVLLVSVPSLDTSVCSRETHRFNESAAALGKDVVILVVSMDLPFAQKRWCGAEGVTAVRTLSDHRDASFGQVYGVLIGDLRLLARAVFVVGRDGKIVYKQLVGEVSSEPDYDAALRAVAHAERAEKA